MKIVEVSRLHKRYHNNIAVKELSFSLAPGEILGLIGPNGAGKSSTVKMLLHFMEPDSGTITLFGEPISEATKARIGYLPEERALYKELPVLQQIIYLAALKGLPRPLARERALQLLDECGLAHAAAKKPKELSKGMGQMIQFIITVIHRPELIILDEPFSGLDPINTQIMQKMIAARKAEGCAIILCTHQMNKVELLCDRVLMMQHGRAVLYDSVEAIRRRFRPNEVYLESEAPFALPDAARALKPAAQGYTLQLAHDTTPQQLLAALVAQGVAIKRYEPRAYRFEEIFLDVAGEADV